MEKSYLETCVMNKLSTRKIAKQCNMGQTSVRYWLSKYGLSTHDVTKPHLCDCGETRPTKFRGHRKSKCAICVDKDSIQEWINKKLKAIAYLGGSCQQCGYNKYYGSMAFHHRDPTQKDVMWGKLKLRPWHKIVKELDKCDLLCHNCHSETHGDQ